MYTPRAFVETDLQRLDALIAAHPFATLVTVAEGSAPIATHLPVLYRRDGDSVLIEGHFARPNPQAGTDADALLIVQGPHGYVSPNWYPDKETAARVPTWNYAVAHLRGRLQPVTDEAGMADLVIRISRRFEQAIGSAWEFEPERDDHRRQLRGIIGFRMPVERIEMTFKLSQNHPRANRDAVIAALQAQGEAAGSALAALMQSTLPP